MKFAFILLLFIFGCSSLKSQKNNNTIDKSVNDLVLEMKDLFENGKNGPRQEEIAMAMRRFLSLRWFDKIPDLVTFLEEKALITEAGFAKECMPTVQERADNVFSRLYLNFEANSDRSNVCSVVYRQYCKDMSIIDGDYVYSYQADNLEKQLKESSLKQDVITMILDPKTYTSMDIEEHLEVLEYFKICRLGDGLYGQLSR